MDFPSVSQNNIGVSDRWFPSIRCRYEVQRESAIMSILRDWHANDAITSVVVVRGIETSAAEEELLKTLAAALFAFPLRRHAVAKSSA